MCVSVCASVMTTRSLPPCVAAYALRRSGWSSSKAPAAKCGTRPPRATTASSTPRCHSVSSRRPWASRYGSHPPLRPRIPKCSTCTNELFRRQQEGACGRGRGGLTIGRAEAQRGRSNMIQHRPRHAAARGVVPLYVDSVTVEPSRSTGRVGRRVLGAVRLVSPRHMVPGGFDFELLRQRACSAKSTQQKRMQIHTYPHVAARRQTLVRRVNNLDVNNL